MHFKDEDKTIFIAKTTNYYYRVMYFGLKNAWLATNMLGIDLNGFCVKQASCGGLGVVLFYYQ